MAVTFLEPGGDATFNVAAVTAGGFYQSVGVSTTIVTDFVHGGHVKSIKFAAAANSGILFPDGVVGDTGGRISFYVYFVALPTAAKARFLSLQTAGAGASIARLYITSAGVLQLWRGAALAQLGTDGSTLSTGVWYRITLAYTITSATVNEWRVYKNNVLDITASNSASITTASSTGTIGNSDSDTTLDLRGSDIFIDNSSALSDIASDVWVTAKRPNANGSVNGFTTQIGVGGSSYGTGHSPQVNERALSTTNGWSMVGAGSAITEEYSIEDKATGDIDISKYTVLDYLVWVYQTATVSETATLVYGGANSTYATGTAANMITKVKGSSVYPAGGTDVGVITSTDLTTFSLYECGVVVAYNPSAVSSIVAPMLPLMGVG
jgi:hypothetical protein